MTVGRFDQMVLGDLAQACQAGHHLFGLIVRVQPIRGECEKLKGGRYGAERFRQGFAAPGNIIKIECLGQLQEGIGEDAGKPGRHH